MARTVTFVLATASLFALTTSAGAATPRSHAAHATSSASHGAHHARSAKPANPPPADVTRLMQFRGVWNFDGTIVLADGKSHKLRWRMGCGSVAGGWALSCDDTIHVPRAPVMKEHDFLAVQAGIVHFYVADNTGETHELHGKWSNDHHVHCHYDGMSAGKHVIEDADLTFTDPATIDFSDRSMSGGALQMTIKGTFHQAPKHSRGHSTQSGDDDQSDPEQDQ